MNCPHCKVRLAEEFSNIHLVLGTLEDDKVGQENQPATDHLGLQHRRCPDCRGLIILLCTYALRQQDKRDLVYPQVQMGERNMPQEVPAPFSDDSREHAWCCR